MSNQGEVMKPIVIDDLTIMSYVRYYWSRFRYRTSKKYRIKEQKFEALMKVYFASDLYLNRKDN